MSTFGSCSLCGNEILEKDSHDRYVQVVGWVPVVRGRPSSKALKARRETGAVAHAHCVLDRNSKMERGIPVQQQGLF